MKEFIHMLVWENGDLNGLEFKLFNLKAFKGNFKI